MMCMIRSLLMVSHEGSVEERTCRIYYLDMTNKTIYILTELWNQMTIPLDASIKSVIFLYKCHWYERTLSKLNDLLTEDLNDRIIALSYS
jgi:hypothetical protein